MIYFSLVSLISLIVLLIFFLHIQLNINENIKLQNSNLSKNNKRINDDLDVFKQKRDRNLFIDFMLLKPSVKQYEQHLAGLICHPYHVSLKDLSLAKLKKERQYI